MAAPVDPETATLIEGLQRAADDVDAAGLVVIGAGQALKWWSYWRVFYLACAELWKFRGGIEWHVSHYLFRKR